MADQEALMQVLKTVYDPEVGVNVVDLGLIEQVEITDELISVKMIMTTPACPLHGVMERDAETAVRSICPDHDVKVEMLSEPLWDPSRMSADGRRELGWPD